MFPALKQRTENSAVNFPWKQPKWEKIYTLIPVSMPCTVCLFVCFDDKTAVRLWYIASSLAWTLIPAQSCGKYQWQLLFLLQVCGTTPSITYRLCVYSKRKWYAQAWLCFPQGDDFGIPGETCVSRMRNKEDHRAIVRIIFVPSLLHYAQWMQHLARWINYRGESRPICFYT